MSIGVSIDGVVVVRMGALMNVGYKGKRLSNVRLLPNTNGVFVKAIGHNQVHSDKVGPWLETAGGQVTLNE